jgi:hypothetical protein
VIVQRYGQIIPPFPTPTVVGAVRVPEPPKLTADATPDECVRVCARAYVGAVESRYAERCWMRMVIHKPERAAKGVRDVLRAAAEILRDRGVAPASWAAWSVDSWFDLPHVQPGDPPPSHKWVFSLERLRKSVGWFSHDESAYEGRTWHVSAEHRELLAMWYAMRDEVLRLHTVDERAVFAAVARVCGGNRWRDLLARARHAARDAQRTLDEAVQHGAFLW